MTVLTVHRRPDGDPADLRVVADGFKPSVFFFAPIALLVRKLWVPCLLWLVVVLALVGAAAAGWLAGWAAVLAVIVLHTVLAIDTPNLERLRLQKRGWSIVAVSSPSSSAVSTPTRDPGPATASPVRSPTLTPATDVIGLFPGGRS